MHYTFVHKILYIHIFFYSLAELVLKDPVFKRDDRYFLSTEEAFEKAMKKSVRFIQVLKENEITNALDRHLISWYVSVEFVHTSMEPICTCTMYM